MCEHESECFSTHMKKKLSTEQDGREYTKMSSGVRFCLICITSKKMVIFIESFAQEKNFVFDVYTELIEFRKSVVMNYCIVLRHNRILSTCLCFRLDATNWPGLSSPRGHGTTVTNVKH
jgi:hypothetical protein